MGFDGASGFHPPATGGGGGGTIGGGGTLNYIAMFTPDGTHIGDSILTQDPSSDPSITEGLSSAKISTADATITTIQTIAIPTDSVVLIESKIVARKAAGTGAGTIGDGNGYIRTTKVKNVGGVVTIGTIQSSYTSEDIAAFNVTFSVSGTNILVRVTGSVNNNVDWRVTTKTNILN